MVFARLNENPGSWTCEGCAEFPAGEGGRQGWVRIWGAGLVSAWGAATRRRGNEKSSPRGLLLEFGAGNRSRTYDLRITNALLYQLSYAGKTICFISSAFPR